MNRYFKVGLGILAIAVILQTIWFMSIGFRIPYVSELLSRLVAANQQLADVLAIIVAALSVLLALIILGLVVFSRTTQRDLKIKSDHGELVIAKNSLESIVAKSVAQGSHVGNVETSVSVNSKGNRVKTQVKAVNLSNADQTSVSKQIMQDVNDCLKSQLGVNGKTSVRLTPLKSKPQKLKVI